MQAGEITCPYTSLDRQNCEAAPGEVCRWTDWAGQGLPPTYHADRIELAASMDCNAKPVDQEAFDQAVLTIVD